MAELKTKKQLMRMNAEQLEKYFRERGKTVMVSLGWRAGNWNEAGYWYATMDLLEAEGEYFYESPGRDRYYDLKWRKKEHMLDFFLQFENDENQEGN
jgi:hypothetical protein